MSRDSGGDWMAYSRDPSLDASGRVVVFVTRHAIDEGDDGYDEDLVVQTHASGNQQGAASGGSVRNPDSRLIRIAGMSRDEGNCVAADSRQPQPSG